ncbi:MAG: 16S rRNA methyltransferase [Candidatus Thermoplasmatota archaeon]|nr:16S rRNA methyltransferase [Candidatus Thermoplasmatota archaeon]
MTGIPSEGPILHLLLADSELELVPKEHWSHPCVAVNARKRGKRASQVLLDSTIHHPLFKDPFERSRRGRPDIVHQFLLMGLDSLLNIDGRLRLWVHTRGDDLIEVSEKTRLPKNYARYQGLFEELLATGRVPGGGDPLLVVKRGVDIEGSLKRIERHSSHRGRGLFRILMSDKGRLVEASEMFKDIIGSHPDSDVLCIIGGFSVGDLISTVEVDERWSVHHELLKVWTVECELLSAFRWAAVRGIRASEGP